MFGYRDITIGARATAARIDMAGFSLGTRLASVQGGLPGALLSQLVGSELSLSVMDYNALVSGQVDLLKTADLLRTSASVRADSFDDVLATDVVLLKLATAMAGSTTSSTAAKVLRSVASKLPNRMVRPDKIIGLGALGASMSPIRCGRWRPTPMRCCTRCCRFKAARGRCAAHRLGFGSTSRW